SPLIPLAVMFLIFEKVPNLFARGGLAQRADKAIVTQAARHVLQSTQMVSRTILRRNQHDENENRLAVQALKWHSAMRYGHRTDQAIHARMFGVRDGYTSPDAGRTQ